MSWREKLYLATFYPIDEMRKRAYKLVGFVFCFCVVTAGFAFHAAQASPEKDGEIIVPSRVPYSLTQMLLDHPNIQQSVANACQAIFVLGQRRAETKLNLSATISGERQLASNFNTGNDDSDNSRSRAYNRSNDNLYDLEVAARYRCHFSLACQNGWRCYSSRWPFGRDRARKCRTCGKGASFAAGCR